MTTLTYHRAHWPARPVTIRLRSRSLRLVDRTLAALESRFRTWRLAWRAWWQRRRDPDDIATLDAHMLRDLGLSLSEVESFQAESDGRAQRTRLRVASFLGGFEA